MKGLPLRLPRAARRSILHLTLLSLALVWLVPRADKDRLRVNGTVKATDVRAPSFSADLVEADRSSSSRDRTSSA